MPMQFYQCSKGHQFEQYLPPTTIGKQKYSLDDIVNSYDNKSKSKKIRCKKSPCKSLASPIYLSKRAARAARNFNPAIFFVNKFGEVINLGTNDLSILPDSKLKELLDSGYEQVQINNIIDYNKFQRSQISKLSEQQSEYMQDQQNQYDQEIRKNIDLLERGGEIERIGLNGKPEKVIIPPLSQMHPTAQAFARHSIEQALKHRLSSSEIRPLIGSLEYDGKLPGTDIDSQYYRDDNLDRMRRNG
jgi:hypothetical protein